MKCDKVRLLFSDHLQGELRGRAQRRLEEHLAGCGECRDAREAFDETMALLAGAAPPELPDDFDASLHRRLVQAAEASEPTAAPAWAPRAPLWRRALQSGVLVASGVAVGFLALWLAGWSPRTSVPGPTRTTPAPRIVRRSPEPAAASRLKVGQVAVLTLAIEAREARAGVQLQVVLPDGLALVGEDYAVLEEKRLAWQADLKAGKNLIRIPVKAQREGTWRLVARALAPGLRIVSEERLRVSRS